MQAISVTVVYLPLFCSQCDQVKFILTNDNHEECLYNIIVMSYKDLQHGTEKGRCMSVTQEEVGTAVIDAAPLHVNGFYVTEGSVGIMSVNQCSDSKCTLMVKCKVSCSAQTDFFLFLLS